MRRNIDKYQLLDENDKLRRQVKKKNDNITKLKALIKQLEDYIDREVCNGRKKI